jgi:hypothetical protein
MHSQPSVCPPNHRSARPTLPTLPTIGLLTVMHSQRTNARLLPGCNPQARRRLLRQGQPRPVDDPSCDGGGGAQQPQPLRQSHQQAQAAGGDEHGQQRGLELGSFEVGQGPRGGLEL